MEARDLVYPVSDITREACDTDSDVNHLYPQPFELIRNGGQYGMGGLRTGDS